MIQLSCEVCQFITLRQPFKNLRNYQQTDARCTHPEKTGNRSMKTYVLWDIYHLGKSPKTCPLKEN